MSALLHALMAMSPTQFPQPSASAEEEADPLPVKSYLCHCKQPKKRKESTLKVSEANIEKHVYGRMRKNKLPNLEDFDPRPVEYQGTANDNMKQLFDKVRCKGLRVSLLDPSTRVW